MQNKKLLKHLQLEIKKLCKQTTINSRMHWLRNKPCELTKAYALIELERAYAAIIKEIEEKQL